MNAVPPSRALTTLTTLVGALLLAYPVLTLSVKGGTNAVLLLLLLLALWVRFASPKDLRPSQWGQPAWRGYLAAMLALPLVTLVSQLANQPFSGHAHDAPARYFLALPVFFLLQRLPLRAFDGLLPGCALATLAGWLLSRPLDEGRLGVPALDLIHYGDLALLLGVLALCGLLRPAHTGLRALYLLGGLAGIAASLLSGSRGGWLALPVLLLLVLHHRGWGWQKLLATLLALCLLVSALFAASPAFQQRVTRLGDDYRAWQVGNHDTSLGARLQLYRAAISTVAQHPLLGVGPTGFAAETVRLQQAGQLTPYAAQLGQGEIHNDLLSKAAGMGLPGLLAMLAIYLVPLHLFRRAARLSPAQRYYALLGKVFVLACLIFGLSVEFLNLTLATAFYSLGVAILLAACYNPHHPTKDSHV